MNLQTLNLDTDRFADSLHWTAYRVMRLLDSNITMTIDYGSDCQLYDELIKPLRERTREQREALIDRRLQWETHYAYE